MLKSKPTWIGIFLLIFFDQGIKLYISSNLAAEQPIPVFPPVLYVYPTLNTNYTWISSMMDLSLSKWIYIALVAFLLVLIILFYRYLQNRLQKNNTVNVLFAFVFSGAVCSLVDKIFWNGSLDFIQISHLFTFDTKDVYVSIFIGLVLLFLVQNNKIIRQIGSPNVLRGFADQFKTK